MIQLCFRLAEILQVSKIEMEGEFMIEAVRRGEIKEALQVCRYKHETVISSNSRDTSTPLSTPQSSKIMKWELKDVWTLKSYLACNKHLISCLVFFCMTQETAGLWSLRGNRWDLLQGGASAAGDTGRVWEGHRGLADSPPSHPPAGVSGHGHVLPLPPAPTDCT